MSVLAAQTRIREYRLERQLSRTAMGQVWVAEDTSRNRRVAIKLLSEHLAGDPDFHRRFLAEIERHSRLEHAHIVPVYDWFADRGLMCLVMRYIQGTSLAKELESHSGPLPLQRALKISADILSALNYANQAGVIHRDVKPSNILLDSSDEAHLIDFGIALAVGDIRLTRVGDTVGTPLYMSPEQVRGERDLDHRTDVYSFGCVLYEMLTGRPPFLPNAREGTDISVRRAHLEAIPDDPCLYAPDLDPELGAIVLQALEKNVDDRLPGCGEFKRVLEPFRYRTQQRRKADPPPEQPIVHPKRRWYKKAYGPVVFAVLTFLSAAAGDEPAVFLAFAAIAIVWTIFAMVKR